MFNFTNSKKEDPEGSQEQVKFYLLVAQNHDVDENTGDHFQWFYVHVNSPNYPEGSEDIVDSGIRISRGGERDAFGENLYYEEREFRVTLGTDERLGHWHEEELAAWGDLVWAWDLRGSKTKLRTLNACFWQPGEVDGPRRVMEKLKAAQAQA